MSQVQQSDIVLKGDSDSQPVDDESQPVEDESQEADVLQPSTSSGFLGLLGSFITGVKRERGDDTTASDSAASGSRKKVRRSTRVHK